MGAMAGETGPLVLEGGRATPLARWARRARDWVRGSPGTHAWLLVLSVTSTVIAVGSPQLRAFVLHHNSTNLAQLRDHPLRVLVASAMWIESPTAMLLYVPVFEAVHAPAERWLGTWRWLAVVAGSHVGATLVSQQAVLLGIRYERLPESLVHTVDIGVSYGLAGVVGVLAHRMPGRWRWAWAGAAVAVTGAAVVRGRTFTDLGHFTALLIGLACWGLAAGRPR